MQQARRPAGRPRTKLLDQEKITAAAFELFSAPGGEDFTMAQLAEKLGVRPPALYNHVRDRRALVNLVRTEVAARIDTSSFADCEWDTAIVPWARSYRTAFATSPQLIAQLAVVPIDGTEASIQGYETITRCMLRGGWPEAAIVPAIVALESFIIGSSLDVLAAPGNLDPVGDEERVPTFAAALAAARDGEGTMADAAFEVGLEALIAGLRVRLARLATG